MKKLFLLTFFLFSLSFSSSLKKFDSKRLFDFLKRFAYELKKSSSQNNSNSTMLPVGTGLVHVNLKSDNLSKN